MKKILLINPPWIVTNKKNIWKKVASCMPPLGLAYIAAYLEKNRLDVRILDMTALNTTPDQLRSYLLDYSPEFIGLTAPTVMINNAYKIAEFCKKYCNAKIIIGGVHPSAMPDEALGKHFIDYVARGEGENTFLELVSGKKVETIDGLSFKKNGKVFHNKSRGLIDNLDELPMPAYHLLPIKKYRPALGSYKRLPAISIVTSRGCPGQCTFCFGSVLGNRFRFRSAEKIFEEVKYLIDNYGIKEIQFHDDTFTVNKKNVQRFCELVIKNKRDITWNCWSRIDTIDKRTLMLMKKSGCHQIMYGIESADKQILKNIKKHMDLEKAKEMIQLTKKIGIDVRATFMFNNPGETVSSMKKTIKFAKELDPDLALFNITTPYPGTAMFDWAKKRGYILTYNWDDYDLSKTVMKLPTVSRENIYKYYKIAHKEFYLRPIYLIKRLFKIKSINDLKMNISAFRSLSSG